MQLGRSDYTMDQYRTLLTIVPSYPGEIPKHFATRNKFCAHLGRLAGRLDEAIAEYAEILLTTTPVRTAAAPQRHSLHVQ